MVKNRRGAVAPPTERADATRAGLLTQPLLHRLKILWEEKAAVLPGCILAVYDLFRGITRQVWFDADAAASEFQRATLAVQCLEKGTLVLADRLYGSSVELFNL